MCCVAPIKPLRYLYESPKIVITRDVGINYCLYRARSRNFDHDWKKFRDAYLRVWKSMKSEETTSEFYTKLHNDFGLLVSAFLLITRPIRHKSSMGTKLEIFIFGSFDESRNESI